MTESVITEHKWLTYDQLTIAQNDKIEIAKCIQDQYTHHLKNNFARNKNEDLILAMCIRDSWKWMNEVGIDAVRNNEYLSTELKSIKSSYAIERSQWEELCNELKNTNRNLTNENCELQNNVKQIRQLHDAMLNEYQIYKNENESLSHQLNDFKKQHNDKQSKMKEFRKQILDLTASMNYLLKKKDSIIKKHNITIDQLKDQHEYTINQMETTIANLSKQKQEFHQKCFNENEQNQSNASEKGECSSVPVDSECYNYTVNSVLTDNDNRESLGEEMSSIYTNEMYMYKENLRKLFAKYKLIDQSNTIFDLRLSLELTENMLKNSDKYKNERMLADEQTQKFQCRLKHEGPPTHTVNMKKVETTKLERIKYEKRINELENETEEQRTMFYMELEMRENDEKIQTLQQKLTTHSQTISELRSENSHLRIENANFQNSLKLNNKVKQKQQHTLIANKEEIYSLHQEIESLQDQLESLETFEMEDLFRKCQTGIHEKRFNRNKTKRSSIKSAIQWWTSYEKSMRGMKLNC